MNKTKKNRTCCICGKPVRGIGHNPAPLKGEVCCDYCDSAVVFPLRLKQMFCDSSFKSK